MNSARKNKEKRNGMAKKSRNANFYSKHGNANDLCILMTSGAM